MNRDLDSDAESVLDEFADLFNARDLDGLAELLADEVSSDAFPGGQPSSVVEGIQEFVLRNPGVVITRGREEDTPVAVVWLPEDERYDCFGFFALNSADSGLIDSIEYVDTPSDELVADPPEPDEMEEGERWSEWESGEE